MIVVGQENGQYVLSDSDCRAIVLSILQTSFATQMMLMCTMGSPEEDGKEMKGKKEWEEKDGKVPFLIHASQPSRQH